MPWSGRGGSAYSQMEIAEGRKLTTHKSVFVRFPIRSKCATGSASAGEDDGTGGASGTRDSVENEYLLIWTTTPWTLTSNVGAAVNPDLDYLKLQTKRDDAVYYFAKENLNYQRLATEFKEGFGRPEWRWPDDVPKLKTIAQILKEQGGFEELGTIKGAEMVGWEYDGPFDDLPAQQQPREAVTRWLGMRDLVPRLLLNTLRKKLSEASQNEQELTSQVLIHALNSTDVTPPELRHAVAVFLGFCREYFLTVVGEAAGGHVFSDLPESWNDNESHEIALSALGDFLKSVDVNDEPLHELQRMEKALRIEPLPHPEPPSLTTIDDLLTLVWKESSQFGPVLFSCLINALQGVDNAIREKLVKSGRDCHRVIDGGRDSRGNPNVVAGEGTGIVHIAPGCGDIDHKLGFDQAFVVLAPLKEDGTYDIGFGDFTGREAIAPETAELVFEKLKEKHLLVSVETYPHIYPHCWRTGDELVFRLVDEWFINMDWRDEIKDVTREIRWLPDSIDGEEREVEWLSNMSDWMISKKRFWGLALPIWVNENDPSDFDVMGSLAELKERAVEGWDGFEGNTPHRPWIDNVVIESAKNPGQKMRRIEDVGNPWLDAGIVPFSTMHYNHDHDEWQKWYPADLVTECFPGQFRNWFYALLSLSTT